MELNTDLDRIRSICSRFPEAAEGLLQDRPLFHVRRRRFAIFNDVNSPYRKRWAAFSKSLHFATDPSQLADMDRDKRFEVSPHHGFRGWRALDLTQEDINWAKISAILESAYRQVAGKELVEELERNG